MIGLCFDDTTSNLMVFGSEMGSMMVALVVGPKKECISVHRNLISGHGTYFDRLINASDEPDQPISLTAEVPSVVKLFIEYLYTKTIPPVRLGTDRLSQAERLKDLCQLYTFTDRYCMGNVIRNKVMDSIQDGFLAMNKLPEPGLVKAIYDHTKEGSALRDFSIQGLLYGLRMAGTNIHGGMSQLLKDNDTIMTDFLAGVQSLEIPHRDPRIRDCLGEQGCTECYAHPDRLADLVGVWPCTFHVHRTMASGNIGEPGLEVVDSDCYLWSV